MKIPHLKDLPKVFEQYPDIQAVYLFGSHAAGRIHSESDLDLAVLHDGDRLPELKLDILAKLADAGYCDVDLVFLPRDNIVLRYEAVRMNRIVYQRADFDSASTFSLIVRQYLDFLPYLEVQRKALKERILGITEACDSPEATEDGEEAFHPRAPILDDAEMSEIVANDRLLERIKKGALHANVGKGRFIG